VKTFKEFVKEEMTMVTIFCDMDGVLANFLGGITRHLGKTKIDQGDVDKVLSSDAGTSKKWWLNLEPMSDALVLWKYISKYDVQILSACPSICKNDKAVVAGKKAWVKKHLKPSPVKVNIVQRKQKKDFATETNILIDDHLKNIREWELAGGVGIVHKNARKTIKQLEKLIT